MNASAGSTASENRRPMILVVDDEEQQLANLAGFLTKTGFVPLLARSGIEALQHFATCDIDLILLDINMQGINGLQTLQHMRSAKPDHDIPIIFITGMFDDLELTSECVRQSGGLIVRKPYSLPILKAQIDSQLKLRWLARSERATRAQLQLQHEEMLHQSRLAHRLYQGIVHSGCLDSLNAKYLSSPHCLFGGDLLLATYTPSGRLRLMLGDATGHGLSAAIAAMPVADVFYSMSAKGFTVGELAIEVNERLRRMLPTGHFVAAAFLEIDHFNDVLHVWNGGIPNILLCRSGMAADQLESQHLPLGIVAGKELIPISQKLPLRHGDRIVLYSDGLIEATNAQGEPFGLHRLIAAVDGSFGDLFAAITDDLDQFQGDKRANDDISLLVYEYGEKKASHDNRICSRKHLLPANVLPWTLHFRLLPAQLKKSDILDPIIRTVMDSLGLYEHRENIFLILHELFSNALEHGLLELDSTIKDSLDGFSRYYEEREKRLARLESGSIDIEIGQSTQADGVVLSIAVEDSGSGFSHPVSGTSSDPGIHKTHGRGTMLLARICDEVRYDQQGHRCEARYVCRQNPPDWRCRFTPDNDATPCNGDASPLDSS